MKQLDSETLLRNARHTGPPKGTRDRLRGRILSAAASGTLVSATLHTTAAKGATVAAGSVGSGGSLAGAVLPWLLGGLVLGGLGSTSLALLSPSAVGPRISVLRVPASGSAVAHSRELAPRPHPSAPAPIVGSEPGSQSSASDTSASPPERRAQPPSLAPSIERETALLMQAQRALRRADYHGALAELDRYDREFPRGALKEEALCARAIAGCSLGIDSGRRAAAAFAQSYPTSPLLSRVRRACPDLEPP